VGLEGNIAVHKISPYKKALNKEKKGDRGRGKDDFKSNITQSHDSALNICHFNPCTAFRT
jgi:hypothetical protein